VGGAELHVVAGQHHRRSAAGAHRSGRVLRGAWTLYPDPVDFHHYGTFDAYADTNAFVDDAPGIAPFSPISSWYHPERMVMRDNDGQPWLRIRDLSRLEDVLGYDLEAYLAKNWNTVGPDLVDKIHVDVGDMDNFYLNLAVMDLQHFLESTTSPHVPGVFRYGRPERGMGGSTCLTRSWSRKWRRRSRNTRRPARTRAPGNTRPVKISARSRYEFRLGAEVAAVPGRSALAGE
jgi:hypothetical protein